MSFLTPKNLPFEDPADLIRFKLAWRLAIVFTLIFGSLAGVFFYDAKDTFIAYLIAFGISMTSLIYLAMAKKFKVVFFFYAIGGSFVINGAIIYILDSPHFLDFLWLILVILLTFFGLGVRWGLGFAILNLVPIGYFMNYRINDHITNLPEQSAEERIFLTVEMAACLLLISYVIYQFVKITNASERQLREKNQELKERNEIIEKRNEENVVLVKEIHHRVKNNLQIIISLLRLQMSEVKNKEAQESFSEAINRVMVMSSIHQKLYRQEDIARFSIQTYIHDLAKELKQFFAEEKDISIDVQTEIKDIDLKTIVPLGLIINELLSNSFKYAFKERDNGRVNIIIEDLGPYLEMRYKDDGIWKEKSTGGTGFGLELIETLTEQLNGLFRRESTSTGTLYSFELQKLKED